MICGHGREVLGRDSAGGEGGGESRRGWELVIGHIATKLYQDAKKKQERMKKEKKR